MDQWLSGLLNKKSTLYFLLALPVILMFSGSVGFGFSPLDEQWMILKNKAYLEDASNIVHSFARVLAEHYYRPLFMGSLIFDYHFSELSPKAYHVMNVVWHLACVVLFYHLLLSFGVKQNKAYVLSLLFSIHPMVVHAVAWVPGRNDLMLCFFSLLSMYSLRRYLLATRPLFLMVYFLSLFAALFTKETAVVLPFIALAMMLLFPHSLKRNISYALMASGFLIIVVWNLIRLSIVAPMPIGIDGVIARGLVFTKVFLVYLGKSIFPFQQSLYPTLNNTNWAMYLIPILILGGCVYKFGFEDKKLMLLCLLSFAMLAVIPSWFATTKGSSEFYEHRVYSALPWLLIFVGNIRFDINHKFTKNALLIVLLFFAVKTYSRLKHYKDKSTFSITGMKESPDFYLFFQTQGEVEYDNSNIPKALELFTKAIALRPDKAELYSNRGTAYFSLGDFNAAISDYTEAIKKAGMRREFVLNRCIAYTKVNNTKAALEDYKFLKSCCNEIIPQSLHEKLGR